MTRSHRDESAQGHRHSYEENSDLSPSDRLNAQEILSKEDDEFPDEDFDALPVDELDAMFQENTDFSQRVMEPPRGATTAQTEQTPRTSSGSRFSPSKSTMQKRDYGGRPAAPTPSASANAVRDMDEDMDCILIDVQTGGTPTLPVQQGPSTSRESYTKKTNIGISGCGPGSDSPRSTASHRQSLTPALSLSSTPFTYLCLLEQMMSGSDFQTTEIRLKAFIVTLLGKLSSRNNAWNICATISDGTGYLDVELSDEVLRGLLGFSVEEKGLLKRDPLQRGQLETGMRRCQEELVDMCCIMTLVVEAEGRKAVVTKAEAVSEKVLQQLEQRLRAGRK